MLHGQTNKKHAYEHVCMHISQKTIRNKEIKHLGMDVLSGEKSQQQVDVVRLDVKWS